MSILLSQTYQIVTEESAEQGEAAERGYEWQDVPHTFREVVELISSEGFNVPSNTDGVPSWLSTQVIQDRAFFEDGESRTLSLHPGNDARSQRYWAKACRAADMLKDAEYWRARIRGIHANGLRALVTYKGHGGCKAKGLATHNATKGIGPAGQWFVCVASFANRVPLDNVICVEVVKR
jgi:hypothetical protein